MRRPIAGAGSSGVTLLELLIASCISAVALAGAWPFVWNAGDTARAVGARAQAATAGAYALRVVGDDLAQAVQLLPTPVGRTPSESFAVLHRHPGEAPETVTVVWDSARGVLWRKASGTYLADHVRAFAVRYFAAEGEELVGASLQAPAWMSRVERLEVTVVVDVHGRVMTRVLHRCLGCA
jgi:type II secretory pathway component PulJ